MLPLCYFVRISLFRLNLFKTRSLEKSNDSQDVKSPLMSSNHWMDVIWVMGELAMTSCLIVCVGFWAFSSFEPYKPLGQQRYL